MTDEIKFFASRVEGYNNGPILPPQPQFQFSTVEQFRQRCQTIGFTPTPAEEALRWLPNGFTDIVTGLDLRDDPNFIPPRLEVEVSVRARVSEIVRTWEIDQNDPSSELATHFFRSLTGRVSRMVWSPYEAMGIGAITTSTKKIRDELCRKGKQASSVPLEYIPGYTEGKISKLPLLTRLFTTSLRETQNAFGLARQELSKIGIGQDENVAEMLDLTTGDCLVTFLQSGEFPFIRQGIEQSLSGLYDYVGLDRYTSGTVIHEALDKLKTIRAVRLSRVRISPSPQRIRLPKYNMLLL